MKQNAFPAKCRDLALIPIAPNSIRNYFYAPSPIGRTTEADGLDARCDQVPAFDRSESNAGGTLSKHPVASRDLPELPVSVAAFLPVEDSPLPASSVACRRRRSCLPRRPPTRRGVSLFVKRRLTAAATIYQRRILHPRGCRAKR